jgi:phosphate starvation-inducible PhoH-like protein
MSKNNRIKRELKQQAGSEVKTSDVIEFDSRRKRLHHQSPLQEVYISSLRHDRIVIGAGKAGTGKTYVASRVASELYLNDDTLRYIILTRPNVEAGEKLGFLPGELEEKYEPYMQPFEQGFRDGLGKKFESDLKKNIFPQPLGYMRGKTFDNSIIMLDEAQNTTVTAMKMFISRIGMNSRMFITGDSLQCDLRLKPGEKNGLQWLMDEVRKQQKPIDIIEFGTEDCVRSEECKMMLDLIDNSDY